MAKNKRKRTEKEQRQPLVLGGRKQKRKELRQRKKELKQAFYLKRFNKGGIELPNVDGQENAEKIEAKQKNISVEREKVDSLKKLQSQAEVKRKKMLKRANRDEDATILKLEKQLNMKKRKKTEKESSIPKSFMDDGLGYILEMCESGQGRTFSDSEEENEKQPSDAENSIDQSEEDIQDEDDLSSDKEIADESKSDGDSESDDSEVEDEEQSGDDDSSQDEICEGQDEVGDENVNNEETKNESTWEDIYGRKRDAQGNVLATKYVPPALRGQSGSADLLRLEKQLKGQLNRLAESNMQGISRFVEDLYNRNSRNNMNETLFKILKSAIVLPAALTPERLVMEHAALVALLHANVGIEVGANITQKWVETFVEEYERSNLDDDDSTKELDNLLYFTCSLYSFHVIGHELVFDLVAMLLEKFYVKDIELISSMLRWVGFNLRKDDPVRLKGVILEIQKKAQESSDSSSMRVKFMLESLVAIKNNNVKKLPNYDPTYVQHLQKTIRNYYRPSASVTPLRVKLNDLLKADTRGRWWIVGSAWTGRGEDQEEPNQETAPELQMQSKFSEELLELARKMRMNTDSRKMIFCAVMSSSDYMEAFEKLVKLDMKSPIKERECALVLTMCCVKEPQSNPFYPKVAAKLGRTDRKFRLSVQCSIWDRLSAIVEGKASKQACINLANFTSLLIKDGVLTLSCLKKVEFADMNKGLTLYMKTLIKDLLSTTNEQERNSHFALISGNPKFSALRESLRLFLHHFFRKDVDLKARIESAEAAMMTKK